MTIDREQALKRLDGNENLYQKMVDYFIRDYADFPQRMETLLAAQARDGYVLIHSLKNIAASLGAESLANRALNLEAFLKNEDFEKAEHYLELVIQEFNQVKDEIGSHSVRIEPRSNEVGESPYDNFSELLHQLSEGLGSFSPCEVDKAIKNVRQSWFLVPPGHRAQLEEILTLSIDFRYFEAEEKLVKLLD